MRDADRILAELAAEQHQVFSRVQARIAGLSPSTQHNRVVSGALVVCGAKSLHFAGVSVTYRGRLMAGLLDLGRDAMVSGRAAAHLLGLDGFGEGPLEYLIDRAHRHRRTPGTVRSLSRLDRLDRITIDGLACTSATMTVVDLLSSGSDEEAANALDSAGRMRLTAVPVVGRRLDALGRQGRAGVARFERIIAAAVVESWLERRFVSLIRSAGLPIPHAQRRHMLDGVGVVRVDFEFDGHACVIEVGGRLGYLTTRDRQRKERRRNAVQLTGRTIYFFTRNDVVNDPAYVTATVAAALGLDTSSRSAS